MREGEFKSDRGKDSRGGDAAQRLAPPFALPGADGLTDEAIGYLRSHEHLELSVYFALIRSPRVRDEIMALLECLSGGD